MYYIYDNIEEEFLSVAFAEFEDAEREMLHHMKRSEANGMEASFDIYEKIT